MEELDRKLPNACTALGYQLLLVDLNADALPRLASELGNAQFVVANLSSKTELASLRAQIETQLQISKCAFINAGVIVPAIWSR